MCGLRTGLDKGSRPLAVEAQDSFAAGSFATTDKARLDSRYGIERVCAVQGNRTHANVPYRRFCLRVRITLSASLYPYRMIRLFYLLAGFMSLALGAVGIFVPLLPTVPFVILAAFCFARSSPTLERRLLEHHHFGLHIRNWREHGAISRRGKRAALAAFTISAIVGLVLSPFPRNLMPLLAAVIGGLWIWHRPER